ncbi:GNAT family N-acetyltransferase [Cohnella sp.]|uniref:GNAT family N-acetyltransferase n=1 Tax=Cohnella sp. TaxID=1883426 RepID=UPI0035667935
MPKPTSIRAMQFIVYFKLVMILIVLVLSFLLFAIPADFSGGWNDFRTDTLKSMFGIADQIFTIGHLGTVALNFSIPIAAMVLMLFFIRRRKQFPALITGFVVLWFSSNNQIQLLLSIVILLLFFLRSTRLYFRSANSVEPEQEIAAQPELPNTVNGELQDTPKLAPKSLTKKKDVQVTIREATPEDSETIHSLMHIAFEEYKSAIPPSSALTETDESVQEAMRSGKESAVILFEDDTATAMVRYKYIDDAIYFFRLSVIPSRRRRGYARQLVKWIEKQGVSKGLNISRCRVRQSIQNNLVLYQNMGYEIVDQELIVRPDGTVKALTLEKKLGV